MMLFPLSDLLLVCDCYKIPNIISINHWSLKIPFSTKMCALKYIAAKFSVINFLLFIKVFGDVCAFREEL